MYFIITIRALIYTAPFQYLDTENHRGQLPLYKMPKPLSRKYVEEYDSDDGFVEDAPKSKKHKAETKQLKSGVQKDEDGNEFWEVRRRGP